MPGRKNSKGMAPNGRGSNPRFAGIPHAVMDSPDYKELKGSAVKLLVELARQYNGYNNGDLTVALSILKSRGFTSSDTISKARDELVRAGMIVETRQGRFLNPGGRCALYALTWKPMDECAGKDLDHKSTVKPLRSFSLESKSPEPESGKRSHQKEVRRRARDDKGRYSSNQKQVRCMDDTVTRNW